MTAVERIWARIVRSDDQACWPFRGAHSRSGRRNVRYPIARIAAKRPPVRVTRLLLILQEGPVQVDIQPGEDFLSWWDRAVAHFAALDVSHQCDNSTCCNPAHLVFETHSENVQRQAVRRRRHNLNRAAEHADAALGNG